MRLRVGIDLSPAFVGQTGIARYSRALWERVRDDPTMDARGFAAGRGVRIDDPRVRQVRLPLRGLHAAWTLTSRPRAEQVLGTLDVVHCLDMLPPPSRAPLVMTWHDTFALSGPRYHHPRALRLREQRVQAARRADVVIATCDSLAAEVVEHVGVAPDRIIVTQLGADLPTVPAAPPPVRPPYVLAAGAITPRKGFGVLARALAALGDDAPPLVIVGPDGWNAEQVHRELHEALPPNRITVLGDSSEHLPTLYAQATLVAHPSRAEGFGLVCLEAMAAGAAVVAADIPSVREMSAGTVALVAGGEVEPLAEAMARLLRDEAERRRLGQAARERAASYTWDRTYRHTLAAYQLAAG